MVVFNYSGKEINAKIVYYGPGLSGKTTNLEHVYNKTAAHLRGRMVSMKTKADRTLFFDFLPIEGGEIAGFKVRFLLYTVPGQVYYNATRKLVLKGADAIVFVADSQSEELSADRESLKNLEANLSEYGKSLGDVPWVMQYNKRDLPSALPYDKLEHELNPTGVQSFQAVATTGEGVYETLNAATRLVLRELRKQLLHEDSSDEVGGQEVTFGPATGLPEAAGAVGEGRGVASAITDTTPNVPSPGEDASPARTSAEGSCPPYKEAVSGYGARQDQAAPRRDGAEQFEVAAATIAAARIDAGHFEPISGPGSPTGQDSRAPAAPAQGKSIRIPIKLSGNGKPGHVLVNLAVDVEIVVDAEDR
jgi:signal recognition particle receptor subunit beta